LTVLGLALFYGLSIILYRGSNWQKKLVQSK